MTKTLCNTCPHTSFCLPNRLEVIEQAQLNKIITKHKTLKRGEQLFEQGHRFQHFYGTNAGALKQCQTTADGREQIFGFYFPGELIGFDAIDSGHYSYNAIALCDTVACEIPFTKLMALAENSANLAHQLITLMSRRINTTECIPANSSATERIAAFLLNLQHRINSSEPNNISIHLPMSRQEIGNYLGLAVETVSRVITHLQKSGLITARHKTIELLDLDQLKAIVGSETQLA